MKARRRDPDAFDLSRPVAVEYIWLVEPNNETRIVVSDRTAIGGPVLVSVEDRRPGGIWLARISAATPPVKTLGRAFMIAKQKHDEEQASLASERTRPGDSLASMRL